MEYNREYDRKWREKNKEKCRAYFRKWKEKNPEKSREYYRNNRKKQIKAVAEWQKKNIEKVREWRRKRDKKRRLRLRFQILQKYNFTCQYCGRKAPECILEIDHKYPKSKGGLDRIENYILSCRDCNIGKGDVILEEF